MKKEQIITDTDIDKTAAQDFFEAENTIDFFPGMPEKLTVSIAAAILNISEPTVVRMVESKEISLTKTSLCDYILGNYKANKPVI